MSKVYFLHAPAVNLVKIGVSCDPVRRFEELRLLSPVETRIHAIISGGFAMEKELHDIFGLHHSHGEWFHAAKTLMEFATNMQTADTTALLAAWSIASPQCRKLFLEEVKVVGSDEESVA